MVFEPQAEVGNAMYELVAESFLPREHAQIGGERDQVRILPKLRKRLGKEPIRFRDDASGIEKNEKSPRTVLEPSFRPCAIV